MIKITERQIIRAITDHLETCDSDELARLAGEIFGGACFWSAPDNEHVQAWREDIYDFIPNEFYADGLGKDK